MIKVTVDFIDNIFREEREYLLEPLCEMPDASVEFKFRHDGHVFCATAYSRVVQRMWYFTWVEVAVGENYTSYEVFDTSRHNLIRSSSPIDAANAHMKYFLELIKE